MGPKKRLPRTPERTDKKDCTLTSTTMKVYIVLLSY